MPRQSQPTIDESTSQDVTWDPLSVRLNRGPEVCQPIIHKLTRVTHSENTFYRRLLCTHLVSLSCHCGPLAQQENMPSFSLRFFSTDTVTFIQSRISFSAENIVIHALPPTPSSCVRLG